MDCLRSWEFFWQKVTIQKPRPSKSSAVDFVAPAWFFGRVSARSRLWGGGYSVVSTLTNTVFDAQPRHNDTLWRYQLPPHASWADLQPVSCTNLMKTVGTNRCGAVLLRRRHLLDRLNGWALLLGMVFQKFQDALLQEIESMHQGTKVRGLLSVGSGCGSQCK